MNTANPTKYSGRAIRFSTLNKLCKVLDCLPGDILDYQWRGCWGC